jgi:hypothetical protein
LILSFLATDAESVTYLIIKMVYAYQSVPEGETKCKIHMIIGAHYGRCPREQQSLCSDWESEWSLLFIQTSSVLNHRGNGAQLGKGHLRAEFREEVCNSIGSKSAS